MSEASCHVPNGVFLIRNAECGIADGLRRKKDTLSADCVRRRKGGLIASEARNGGFCRYENDVA